MPSPFATLATSAFRTLKSAAGEAVTYHRGNASVAVTAVPGSSTLEQQEEGGFVSQVRSNDWIVAAADLVLSGAAVIPKAGDRIKRAVGATRLVYAVMNPPYRPCDHAGTRLRILTQYVATEAV